MFWWKIVRGKGVREGSRASSSLKDTTGEKWEISCRGGGPDEKWVIVVRVVVENI
jgi:hypothetical protein